MTARAEQRQEKKLEWNSHWNFFEPKNQVWMGFLCQHESWEHETAAAKRGKKAHDLDRRHLWWDDTYWAFYCVWGSKSPVISLGGLAQRICREEEKRFGSSETMWKVIQAYSHFHLNLFYIFHFNRYALLTHSTATCDIDYIDSRMQFQLSRLGSDDGRGREEMPEIIIEITLVRIIAFPPRRENECGDFEISVISFFPSLLRRVLHC